MTGYITLNLKNIFGLFKPAQTAMLMFTAVIGYLTPHTFPFSVYTLLYIIIIEMLAISGTTSINMYLDRDLDAIMERTKNRPIPSMAISSGASRLIGYSLLIVSIVASIIIISYFFALTVFLGYFFDIIIYTILLKRRTSLNIIFGGVAGGMPILGGWVARTGGFSTVGFLLFALILTWIPLHTWVISSINQGDYRAARIPNVPSVTSPGTLFLYLFFASIAFLFISAEIYFLGFTTYLTPLITSGFTAIIIYWSYKAFLRDDIIALRRVRVITSPMLGIVLLILLIR
ncbi:MAG: UbiA family prenyltransferase [Nitrososphaerota archaeon]|nr:UbiA family prenyltransferase [Nitrososphaerota archaeon]